MNEPEVINLVTDAIKDYDREVAQPRHAENLAKFEQLFQVLNKAQGALWAFSLVVGVPGIIATVVVVVKALRH